jgi:monoamine oxidase
VELVRWRRGEATIAARKQGISVEFSAPQVVVTLPLGVLQSGSVGFNPEPENLRNACSHLEMGQAIRLTLSFRNPAWHKRAEFHSLGFLFSDRKWMPTWWTTLPTQSGTITGWTGGPLTQNAGTPDQWLKTTLESLAHLLGTSAAELARDLQEWHTHDWRADPHSRGAYSFVRVGGLEAQRHFGDPIESTLYFAGEAANHEGHSGTVHGAIASGERAARMILEAGVRVG